MDLLNKKFNTAAKNLFNTPDGLVVLAKLKRDFLKSSIVSSDPHMTYYNLGQEDLVKMFINYASDEALEDVERATDGIEESSYDY